MQGVILDSVIHCIKSNLAAFERYHLPEVKMSLTCLSCLTCSLGIVGRILLICNVAEC